MHGWALLWTLLGIFAGGLALNLTPCIYPLIPITVSYFGGRSGRGKGDVVRHGVCYIGGLVLTNSLLGVFAALTGNLMGAMLQNPLVLAGIAGVLIIFASSLFGIWEIKLPFWLTQAASKSYTGFFGSFFMGITLGVVAAPCIGPFIIGLLTWVASLGDPLIGFGVFFTLSLGLGFPLFLLALFSGQLNKLPSSGEWMLWVRRLMSWILLGMAAYFIRSLLAPGFQNYLLAAIAIGAGLHLGWFDRTQALFRAFTWIKVMVGVVWLVLGIYWGGSELLKGPGVKWHPYSETVMMAAANHKKPVIIDFYANWCAPCRKLDEVTFHHPDIVKLSQKDFMMVKVDLTQKSDRSYDELLHQFNVKGVPTVVFLDPNGQEKKELRVIDYIKPDDFLNLMATLR
ncbi:MAG: cytochrome c biogenesis protein CcdA [Desulfobacterales bacterium]|nr:cytochrome c biogenesis protein CcdA [Desulfobacterales bacterium]